MCSLASAAKDGQWVMQGKQLADTARQKGHAIANAAVIFWEAESTRVWIRKWYVRIVAAAALALGLATAVVNLYAVPSVNSNMLPQISASASRVLQRDVRLHFCHTSVHVTHVSCFP